MHRLICESRVEDETRSCRRLQGCREVERRRPRPPCYNPPLSREGRTGEVSVFSTWNLPDPGLRPARARSVDTIHGQDERSGFPAANLRHHLAPRRGQDDAHREAAAVRRRHPARRRGQGARRGAARPLGLDEGRAGARHLGHDLGDDVRVRRLHLQPARHAGPRGLQRGHLPHADRRRLGRHGDRRRQGHRDADPQAVRGLPPARRADHHLHQQARPRGARSLRAARARSSRTLQLDVTPASLADRHGPRASSAATTCATTG